MNLLKKFLALPTVSKVRVILAVLMGALVVWLIFLSDKPWQAPADRENWRVGDYAGVFSFWAGLLNLAPLALLFLTADWWVKGGERLQHGPTRSNSRWFLPVVLGAMLFCAGSAIQRMNFGFAHDEDYSARRVISGSYEVKKDGSVGLDRLSWTETLYYYTKPNNHPLHSILARVVQEGYRIVAPGAKWHMREWVVRIPAFIAAIAAVGMLAVLLRQLGSAGAGMTAAWLMALNPWFIRYASEARGYSLLLLAIPLVLYCWLKALRENSWTWWAAFALSQFALVYSYPGALYVLIVLNSLTVLWLGGHWLRTKDAVLPARWFAANVMAAIPSIQLMLPLVPQLRQYLKTEESSHPLTTAWIQNALPHFLSGTPWSRTGLTDSPFPELLPYAHQHPLFFWALVTTLVLLGIAGFFVLSKKQWPLSAIAAATLIFPALISFFWAWKSSHWLFEWYLIYLLPGLAACVAIGTSALGGVLKKAPWTAAPAVAVLLAYGIFTQPFRHWLCNNPVEPVKESALAVRGTLDPNDPAHSDILTGILLGRAWYYDPRASHLKTREEFLELLRRADAENRPLFITAPHPAASANKVPELWRLFNEAGLFSDYRTFLGMDDTNTRVVAKYVPGSVQNFDAERFFATRQGTPDSTKPPLQYPDKPEL